MRPRYLCQPDGTPHTAETFSWTSHLAAALGTDDPVVQAEMLLLPKVRKLITKTDPLLFAVIYLPHHLRGSATGEEITFSDAHLGWSRMAAEWMAPVTEPRGSRRAEFAPRETGKTTWWYLIIPMWAAAHGWIRFAAAFADTYDQSVGHLRTFRSELADNQMIITDYKRLARMSDGSPEVRGITVDKESMIITASTFVFTARGADTSTLGLKVKERRPDLIILDDIEPHESKYSLLSVRKRRQTVTDAILALNERARVVWVGTTTRHGGLAHRLVEAADGVLDIEDPDNQWISEQRFTARRWDPIITDDAGRERSLWPEKWSLDYLRSIAGTRTYAKNMANQPVSESGDYWAAEDITYLAESPEGLTRTILVLDPDVNDLNQTSDWTGICVASRHGAGVVIRELAQIRKTGRALKDHSLIVLARFPDIRRVVIECNQGFTMWLDIFADFPVPVDLVVADHPKHVRAAMALNHYQARPTRVVHERRFVAGESQMCAFPDVAYDDMVDAVSWAVRYHLEPSTIRRPKGFELKRRPTAEVSSYV